jgi:hypothetical protein
VAARRARAPPPQHPGIIAARGRLRVIHVGKGRRRRQSERRPAPGAPTTSICSSSRQAALIGLLQKLAPIAPNMVTALLLAPLALVTATTHPSSRPRNLLRHVSGHGDDRFDLSQPPPRPPLAMLQGRPPPPVCPTDFVHEAASTGMISVGGFLNSSRNQPNSRVDDAPAVRAAIAVAVNCSSAVFFPPGSYSLHTTVTLPGSLELRGSGLRSAEFVVRQHKNCCGAGRVVRPGLLM